MKKKLANLLFWAIMALPATAQITILAVDDVKKSEPIDELVFRAQYELKMVEDTTKADRQPNSETMMLEVGKKCSQFYSYTTYLRDSTLIADYANKVSQDVLQQHAKAYGNGRITYRIYKNYPTGKVTTLDRLATSNFRCEERMKTGMDLITRYGYYSDLSLLESNWSLPGKKLYGMVHDGNSCK